MKVKALKLDGSARVYLLTFGRGDDIASGLKTFARDHNVVSGTMTAVGALECAVAGWYDAGRKKLRTTVLRGDMEVVSLGGNFATVDGVPITHMHFSAADPNGKVSGGHLVLGLVGPGLEVTVSTTPLPLRRVYDAGGDAFVPVMD